MTARPLSQSDFSVNFEASPEWLAMVRRGIETLLGDHADPRLLGDVKAGVTEACTNAVRHAYPDGDGRVVVEAWLEPEQLTVSVRDFGQGMGGGAPRRGSPGLGVPLMEALSSELAIESGSRGEGTEVVLQFDLPEERDPDPGRAPLLTALTA